MKRLGLVLVAALLTVLAIQGYASGTRKKVKVECSARIYFLPFNMTTLYPMRPELIKDTYNISSCIKEHAYDDILRTLDEDRIEGTINLNAIRLRIDTPDGKTYLVDQSGGMSVNGKAYHLTEQGFKHLQDTLFANLPINPLPN